MARDVLKAFLNRDVQLARAVHTRDDLVDALNDQMFRELITYTMTDPSATERAIHLEGVGRYLERIADHATNIAEDIVFIETGEVIKHQPRVREIPLKGLMP
jgi:phosphate transport system protein